MQEISMLPDFTDPPPGEGFHFVVVSARYWELAQDDDELEIVLQSVPFDLIWAVWQVPGDYQPTWGRSNAPYEMAWWMPFVKGARLIAGNERAQALWGPTQNRPKNPGIVTRMEY